MKQKCKVCGVNAESEYCFRHKLRKQMAKGKWSSVSKHVPLTSVRPPSDGDGMRNWVAMRTFFMSVWNTRPHYCENCRKWLGNEPLSYMFDHLLEKSKYPDLRYEEQNIMMTCLECHDNKTNGRISKTVENRIKEVRYKFGKY